MLKSTKKWYIRSLRKRKKQNSGTTTVQIYAPLYYLNISHRLVEREAIIKKKFREAEKGIKETIQQQRDKVVANFGPLVQEEKKQSVHLFGSKKPLDFSLCEETPVPMEIELVTSRSMKDKVPSGNYVCVACCDKYVGCPNLGAGPHWRRKAVLQVLSVGEGP